MQGVKDKLFLEEQSAAINASIHSFMASSSSMQKVTKHIQPLYAFPESDQLHFLKILIACRRLCGGRV